MTGQNAPRTTSAVAPRVPAGVREGGQWTVSARAEPDLALAAGGREQVADRHAALVAEGFVPAVVVREGIAADAQTWWDQHFIAAEYRAAGGGYPQMPDDYGSSAAGRGLRGRRRVARQTYEGAGVRLQMPAAETVRSFIREEQGTVDIPVAATIEDGTEVSGWVRVTPRPSGGYATAGVGFEAQDQEVAEAVSAVLESRRPRKALNEVGDLLARARERAKGFGAPLQPVDSSWVDAVGYDDANHIMAMRTRTGQLYGHEVSRTRFLAVAGAASPGAQFNRIIKGHTRAAVSNCETCGRFYSAAKAHQCPVTPTTPSVDPISQNVAARARAAAATAPQRAPGEHVREAGVVGVDVARWNSERLARRTKKLGYFGRPGFTQAIAEHLTPHASATYNAFAYNTYEVGGEIVRRENGDNGSLRYAGVGPTTAMSLGTSLPPSALKARHGNAPTTGSALRAAVRGRGKLEVSGYMIGADREDERLAVTSVDLFDDEVTDPGQAIDALRERYELDFTDGPDRVQRVEVPWRPGEFAWRVWWK